MSEQHLASAREARFGLNGRRLPGPIRRERMPRLGRYTVTNRIEIVEHYEGYGLTLDDVIALEAHYFSSSDGSNGPFDLVVWQDDRVMAVIHSHDDTQGSYDVTRFEPVPDNSPPSA
jgi:hypothetical protein